MVELSDIGRSSDVLRTHARHVSPATRLPFPPLVVESGAGTRFTTSDGREYLDFHSMACVLNTGHNHPEVVGAITKQANVLVGCNPGYLVHRPFTDLAHRLAQLLPGGQSQVAFGHSGSDANDGALKLARAATGRWRVFAYDGAYHGSTYGALSLSSVSRHMRRGFGPEIPGVHRLPFPDVYRGCGTAADETARCLAALERELRTTAPPEEVAAVFIEPIQGDSGVLVPPPEYLAGLREICTEHGILLVAEEVQTGMGRTGRLLAGNHVDLAPDIIVLGKALGSGMPISAVVADARLMRAWNAPGHVFSTAGNPISCAAASATLDILVEESLPDRATALGRILTEGLRVLAERHDRIGDIRGRGLMIGVDFVTDRATRRRDHALAAAVVAACLSRGLYLTFLAGNVLRLAPPLTVTEAEIHRALEILDESLTDAVAGRVPLSQIRQVDGW